MLPRTRLPSRMLQRRSLLIAWHSQLPRSLSWEPPDGSAQHQCSASLSPQPMTQGLIWLQRSLRQPQGGHRHCCHPAAPHASYICPWHKMVLRRLRPGCCHSSPHGTVWLMHVLTRRVMVRFRRRPICPRGLALALPFLPSSGSPRSRPPQNHPLKFLFGTLHARHSWPSRWRSQLSPRQSHRLRCPSDTS